MINIAQGNETVTSVAGIGLVGGLLRQCPSLGRLDALRLERTKHGRIPHSRVVLCHICLAARGDERLRGRGGLRRRCERGGISMCL